VDQKQLREPCPVEVEEDSNALNKNKLMPSMRLEIVLIAGLIYASSMNFKVVVKVKL
jgi:hypothetical protein